MSNDVVTLVRVIMSTRPYTRAPVPLKYFAGQGSRSSGEGQGIDGQSAGSLARVGLRPGSSWGRWPVLSSGTYL